MIEILKKNYGIEINDYSEYQNGIVFFIDGLYYYFVKTFYDENYVLESFELSKSIKTKGIKIHDFVFNNNGNIFTDGYVLFKVNVFIDDVSFNDFILFNNVMIDTEFKYTSMIDFWYKKIDYLEKQITELSSNQLINYSFDYFIGISELLLLYLRDNYYNNSKTLVHRTINTLSGLEFYNPLNIMIGDKYKDIVAYIRLKNEWDLFYDLIEKVDKNDLVYIFVRMCFPFYYFDLVSDIILNSKNDKELMVLLTKIDMYEKYLLKVSDVCGINLFFWIKKE